MKAWSDQRVVVTGGGGFLGRHLVERLRAEGAQVVAPTSQQCDLRNAGNARRLLEGAPDCVFHLAAKVGGIGANREQPATFFHETLTMGLHVLEAAREGGARQLVQVGTVCSYPKHTPVPFQEKDLWSGYPEETNAAYGVAKRALIAGSYAFAAQFGLRCANVLLLNLYGEGDNFDPRSSHVIPALIRKCVAAQEAEAAEVEIWGDGTATRGFLYVEDAVEGILLAARNATSAEPINIGTPGEVSIRDLAETIGRLTGFRGKFRFEPSQPNGQPRRALDCSRAERELGFRARTPMSIGLARTVSWYRDQGEQAILFPKVEASATNAGC